MRRFLLIGLAAWLGGTILIRLAPSRLLPTGRPAAILLLYVVSFALMFLVILRAVVRPLGAGRGSPAAIALVLPTLVLDAFASAFFPVVYPNFPASAAGVFAGWMLICCGGGLLAAARGK